MLPFSVMFDRLLNSALATCNTLEKRFDEDTIDWIHRLAKHGLTPWEISKTTGLPYVSIEYWYYSNGYDDA